ncbi:MAG: zinc-finger domain-containing protein [Burkholderiales bacterium]
MSKSTIELKASELNHQGGVYCPAPQAGMQTWNTHPKVFLDVAHSGQAKCPYCGTVYQLKAGEHFAAHH